VAAQGCSLASVDDSSGAANAVEQWLTEAASRTGDRGWRWLHRVTQEQNYLDAVDVYQREADSADWQRFDWQVTGARLFDGEYRVDLSVDDDLSTIPRFLVDRGLLTLVTSDDGSKVAVVAVEIQPGDGTFGILGSP
jgi:hypothetical protein